MEAVKQRTSEMLIRKLANGCQSAQLEAAQEIRLFSKYDDGNRRALVATGAVPVLLNHLRHTQDPKMQENAVTSLLNLSVSEENKSPIATVVVGGGESIATILDTVKGGKSATSRANAAALLRSLMLSGDAGVRRHVAEAEGLSAAVLQLLSTGSSTCKADALRLLYQIATSSDNPAAAEALVSEGAVPLLMKLACSGLVKLSEGCLGVLAELAKNEMGARESLPYCQAIVKLLESGASDRVRENAASVLVSACNAGGDAVNLLLRCRNPGVLSVVSRLLTSPLSSERAKRKAEALIKLLNLNGSDRLKAKGSDPLASDGQRPPLDGSDGVTMNGPDVNNYSLPSSQLSLTMSSSHYASSLPLISTSFSTDNGDDSSFMGSRNPARAPNPPPSSSPLFSPPSMPAHAKHKNIFSRMYHAHRRSSASS